MSLSLVFGRNRVISYGHGNDDELGDLLIERCGDECVELGSFIYHFISLHRLFGPDPWWW